MQNAFDLAVRKSVTGIHMTLSGYFTLDDVETFSEAMKDASKENGNIFMNIRNLQNVSDDVLNEFKSCYAHVPAQSLYFKGEGAERLAHQGNRMIMRKENLCQCAEPCKSCSCQRRAKSRNEKFDFFQRFQEERAQIIFQ